MYRALVATCRPSSLAALSFSRTGTASTLRRAHSILPNTFDFTEPKPKPSTAIDAADRERQERELADPKGDNPLNLPPDEYKRLLQSPPPLPPNPYRDVEIGPRILTGPREQMAPYEQYWRFAIPHADYSQFPVEKRPNRGFFGILPGWYSRGITPGMYWIMAWCCGFCVFAALVDQYSGTASPGMGPNMAIPVSIYQSLADEERSKAEKPKEFATVPAPLADRAKNRPPLKIPMSPVFVSMLGELKELQTEITSSLDAIEASSSSSLLPSFLRNGSAGPAHCKTEPYERANLANSTISTSGSGTISTLTSGSVIENASMHLTQVHGLLPPEAILELRELHAALFGIGNVPATPVPYNSVGLTVEIHPRNPNAPSTHLSLRYFECYDPAKFDKPLAFWWGGGADLSPSYLYEDDAEHFHTTLKRAIDAHGEGYYRPWKVQCDEYYRLPHRENERRGVGGILFDHLDRASDVHLRSRRWAGDEARGTKPNHPSARQLLELVSDIGRSFLPAYLPIVEKRKGMAWTREMLEWQRERRARYAEFMLCNDLGVHVALELPGTNAEAVLAGLPAEVAWGGGGRGPAVEPESREAQLLDVLHRPRVWVM